MSYDPDQDDVLLAMLFFVSIFGIPALLVWMAT